jgi:hypothetical protein
LGSGEGVELEKEPLDDFDEGSEIGVGGCKFSELDKEDIQLFLGVAIDLAVSALGYLDVAG